MVAHIGRSPNNLIRWKESQAEKAPSEGLVESLAQTRYVVGFGYKRGKIFDLPRSA